MKRFALLLIFLISLFGCSKKDPKLIDLSKLEGLSVEEQVETIIEHSKLIDEDYHIVIEDDSLAVVYSTEYIPDSRLIIDNSYDSLPFVAMALVEQLSLLEFDEFVITAYEPLDDEFDMTGQAIVSAMFTKDTINSIDFEEWHEKKDRIPQLFYRLADAYRIQGMAHEKLKDEQREAIGDNLKPHDSDFWQYYGSYVK